MSRHLQYRATLSTADTQLSPTLTNTPVSTPPVVTVTGPQTDTLVPDRVPCIGPRGLIAANVSGGEIRRKAGLEEYVDGTLSSARWSRGTWNGGTYTPTPACGSVLVSSATGAWIRSQASFTQ
jgi:hypothetical protein